MKIILTFFLCLISLLAFSIDMYHKGDELFVHAPSGLKLRATPDGDAIVTVPFGSKLKVIQDKITKPSKIVDGLNGSWAKVDFDGKTGFIFDGYLSFLPTPKTYHTSLLDYCRDTFTRVTDLLIASVDNCDDEQEEVPKSVVQVFSYKGHNIVYTKYEDYFSQEETISITGISNEEAYLISVALFGDEIKKADKAYKETGYPDIISPEAYTKYVQYPKTDCFKVFLIDDCSKILQVCKSMADNVATINYSMHCCC